LQDKWDCLQLGSNREDEDPPQVRQEHWKAVLAAHNRVMMLRRHGAPMSTNRSTQPDRIFRFGQFELSESDGELRKNGARIKLQDQPFRVLVELVANSGKAVTREELQQKLWPADTFVDFDVGLNTAIRKLRQAMGDDADHPHYIETLARRGYRFLAQVAVAVPDPAGGEPSIGSGAYASNPRDGLLIGCRTCGR
jgi:DNA-binding winged helix-turn-helix (wHTH) protein